MDGPSWHAQVYSKGREEAQFQKIQQSGAVITQIHLQAFSHSHTHTHTHTQRCCCPCRLYGSVKLNMRTADPSFSQAFECLPGEHFSVSWSPNAHTSTPQALISLHPKLASSCTADSQASGARPAHFVLDTASEAADVLCVDASSPHPAPAGLAAGSLRQAASQSQPGQGEGLSGGACWAPDGVHLLHWALSMSPYDEAQPDVETVRQPLQQIWTVQLVHASTGEVASSIDMPVNRSGVKSFLPQPSPHGSLLLFWDSAGTRMQLVKMLAHQQPHQQPHAGSLPRTNTASTEAGQASNRAQQALPEQDQRVSATRIAGQLGSVLNQHAPGDISNATSLKAGLPMLGAVHVKLAMPNLEIEPDSLQWSSDSAYISIIGTSTQPASSCISKQLLVCSTCDGLVRLDWCWDRICYTAWHPCLPRLSICGQGAAHEVSIVGVPFPSPPEEDEGWCSIAVVAAPTWHPMRVPVPISGHAEEADFRLSDPQLDRPEGLAWSPSGVLLAYWVLSADEPLDPAGPYFMSILMGDPPPAVPPTYATHVTAWNPDTGHEMASWNWLNNTQRSLQATWQGPPVWSRDGRICLYGLCGERMQLTEAQGRQQEADVEAVLCIQDSVVH